MVVMTADFAQCLCHRQDGWKRGFQLNFSTVIRRTEEFFYDLGKRGELVPVFAKYLPFSLESQA